MRIFLSHSTKDCEFVKKLAAELKAEEIESWLCEVDVLYGDNFVAKIEEGLRESDLTLLVFSPEAARSPWTQVEWTSVLHREVSESRVRLGVLLLRDCQLPELLRDKHRIDARSNPDHGRREVLGWIKRLRDMRCLEETGGKAVFVAVDYEPEDFVGRAEYLEHLHAALAHRPGVFLLHGGPGCGKSLLARKFIWQAQGQFDAVVFQICGQRGAEAIGIELAERLTLDVKRQSPERQITAAKNWLKQRRSLLVLDDLWNEDVQTLIPGPPVSVLVTSRQRSLSWDPSCRNMNLESFSEQEVETIFENYLGRETLGRHRKSLLDLAERVERLPIAVVVAADILRREFDPVDEVSCGLYLERLRNKIHDVPGLLERAIESQPEDVRRLLLAMAVCAPEGFWFPLAAEIAGLDDGEKRQARDQLMNSSLLRMLDRDRQRFQLHALLREQLRKSPSLAELQGRHAAALESIFQEWESRWRHCRECLPEVIAAIQFLSNKEEAQRLGWLGSRGFATARRVGEMEAALRIVKQEQRYWLTRAPEAKDGLAASYGNQALILRDWGRLEEALELHTKEEALYLELNNRDGLQRTYGNQAVILQNWGWMEGALELHKKEEALCQELGHKDGLQASYGNQALILRDWERLEEARELHKKQESLCLELGQKAGLGYCYWNLGLLTRRLKDPESAYQNLLEALNIFNDLKMTRERNAVQSELKKIGRKTKHKR